MPSPVSMSIRTSAAFGISPEAERGGRFSGACTARARMFLMVNFIDISEGQNPTRRHGEHRGHREVQKMKYLRIIGPFQISRPIGNVIGAASKQSRLLFSSVSSVLSVPPCWV